MSWPPDEVAPSGTMTLDEGNYYLNDQKCHWRVITPPDTLASLHWLFFNMEEDYDYVKLLDPCLDSPTWSVELFLFHLCTYLFWCDCDVCVTYSLYEEVLVLMCYVIFISQRFHLMCSLGCPFSLPPNFFFQYELHTFDL